MNIALSLAMGVAMAIVFVEAFMRAAIFLLQKAGYQLTVWAYLLAGTLIVDVTWLMEWGWHYTFNTPFVVAGFFGTWLAMGYLPKKVKE